MPKQESLMVTCIGCNHVNQIPIGNLLDYSCITCGKSPLQLKETEQETLVHELDEASNEMDRVIGNSSMAAWTQRWRQTGLSMNPVKL